MIWLAFLLGFVVGAMATCAACAWWAFSAMGEFNPETRSLMAMADAEAKELRDLLRHINRSPS